MSPHLPDTDALVAWVRERDGEPATRGLASWLRALLLRFRLKAVGASGVTRDQLALLAARTLPPSPHTERLASDGEFRAAVAEWLRERSRSRADAAPPLIPESARPIRPSEAEIEAMLREAHAWGVDVPERGAAPRAPRKKKMQTGGAGLSRNRLRRSAPPPPPPPEAAPPAPAPAPSAPPARAPEPEAYAAGEVAPAPVYLGAAAPRSVRPGDWFQAELAAYVQAYEAKAAALLARDAAPGEVQMGTPAEPGWKAGAPVIVRLTAPGLRVAEPELAFTWDGKYRHVEFDVEVPADAPARRTVLRFELFIGGIRVGRLVLSLEVAETATAPPGRAVAEARAPRRAFVSYARKDQKEVYGRVATLRTYTRDDFFVDRLNLRMGRRWKPQLEKAILDADEFLLFWSPNAGRSRWVTREWTFALAKKDPDDFQLHLLEKVDIGSVPAPLRDYQLEDPLLDLAAATEDTP